MAARHKSKEKRITYIEIEPRLQDTKNHEQHEERAFRRLAQAMGYRLPGAEARRKHELEE